MEKEILEQKAKDVGRGDERQVLRAHERQKELAMLFRHSKIREMNHTGIGLILVSEGRIEFPRRENMGNRKFFLSTVFLRTSQRALVLDRGRHGAGDVFIPEDRTGAALHGDRVQIMVESQDRGGSRRLKARCLSAGNANRGGWVLPEKQGASGL